MSMQDLFSLDGKIAVITGGSVGIGAMIAEGFVSFGARVYLVARNEDALRKTRDALAQIGSCEYLVADVSTVEGIEALAAAFGEREQSLDILVNNAGISDGRVEVDAVREETWDEVMDLNIKSIFFTIQKLLPFLRVGASTESPKKVINIASIDGVQKINPVYNFAYGVSKAGVIQLSRHLGDRLAWEGIQLNTISPGDFPSRLNTVARDHAEELKQVTPAKRVGAADNVAGAALFLASRAGDFSVGSNIIIDGGASVRGIQRELYTSLYPDIVFADR